MREFSHTITNRYDLAAKPAYDLIRLSREYNCRTYVVKNDIMTDISRLFILLSIGIKCGDTIKFVTEGADEKSAIDKIGNYISCYM